MYVRICQLFCIVGFASVLMLIFRPTISRWLWSSGIIVETLNLKITSMFLSPNWSLVNTNQSIKKVDMTSQKWLSPSHYSSLSARYIPPVLLAEYDLLVITASMYWVRSFSWSMQLTSVSWALAAASPTTLSLSRKPWWNMKLKTSSSKSIDQKKSLKL